MKKAIVLGGSRGIGKAISESLKSLEIEVITASKSDIDTSNIESVRKFSHEHPKTDILILNTGGPPVIEFNKISENDWNHYHNQLFVGFCTMLQEISINDKLLLLKLITASAAFCSTSCGSMQGPALKLCFFIILLPFLNKNLFLYLF